MSSSDSKPLSFADPAVQQCPFAAYDSLRDTSPVYRDPLTGNYVLTRYQDIRSAMCQALEEMGLYRGTYLVLGGTTEQLRRNLSAPTYTSSPQALAYSDRMVSLLTSQLLTSQIEDPLRSVLRLDTVRIQFGVSSFDVQLCKRFGLYQRACGLAEWGLLAATAARYRAFGQSLRDMAALEATMQVVAENGHQLLQRLTSGRRAQQQV